MTKNIWGYFDKWYIITLVDRDVSELEKNLRRARVTNYEVLRYVPGKKTKNVPKKASMFELLMHTTCDETGKNITQNHLTTIQKAYDNGFQNVVILEDDAEFQTPVDSKKLENVCKWLSSSDWEIFFLGHCPWPIPLSLLKNKDIVQPYSALLAHCYSLSRKGMKKILKYGREMEKSGKWLQPDKIYQVVPLKKYAMFPSISYQNKPPAIFKEIFDRIGISLPYNKIFLLLEVLAVVLPVIILLLIIYFIIRFIRRSRCRSSPSSR